MMSAHSFETETLKKNSSCSILAMSYFVKWLSEPANSHRVIATCF